MRSTTDVRHRSFLRRLLVVVALPFSLACHESTTPLPTAVADPEPPRVDAIFLADASGAVTGELTKGSWPSWSPDGRRIAFHREGQIRVIGADGSGEVGLPDGRWPTWSPDGSRIAYVSSEGISVVNADGSGARTLMAPALFAVHAPFTDIGNLSWSPDGAFIAFDQPSAYADGYRARIFVMSADGTRQYVVAGQSDFETEPSWLPDGRILYWSTTYGIGIAERIGGPTESLYKDGLVAFDARPAWSPSGRGISFNTTGPAPSIMTVSADRSSLNFQMDGPETRVLIQNGFHAAWSPDGARIAFVRMVAH